MTPCRAWLAHFARRLRRACCWWRTSTGPTRPPSTSSGLLVDSGVPPGVMVVITSRHRMSTPWEPQAPCNRARAPRRVARRRHSSPSHGPEDDALNTEQQGLVIERGGGFHSLSKSSPAAPSTTRPVRRSHPDSQELLAVRCGPRRSIDESPSWPRTLGSVFEESSLPESGRDPSVLCAGPTSGRRHRRAGRRRSPELVPLQPWARSETPRAKRPRSSTSRRADPRPDRHSLRTVVRSARATWPSWPSIRPGRAYRRGRPAYIAAAQAAQADASHIEARRLLDRALELLDSLPKETSET